MSGFMIVLLVIAMVATVGVLFLGLFSMARGGEFNARNSNKLMRARIVCQAVALALFALLMLLMGKT
jgi:NADH:ubiquinone oxidoreductase subunit 6 (subunit J)